MAKLYDWERWARQRYVDEGLTPAQSLKKAREVRSKAGKLAVHTHKLTDEQIKEIRASKNYTLTQLADQYGVSHFYISRIRNNKVRV